MIRELRNYIGGKWLDASSGGRLESVNPARRRVCNALRIHLPMSNMPAAGVRRIPGAHSQPPPATTSRVESPAAIRPSPQT